MATVPREQRRSPLPSRPFHRRGRAPRVALLVAVCAVLAALAAPATAWAQNGGPAGVHVDQVREVPLDQTTPVIGRLVATRAGVVAARVDAPVASFVVEVGDRVRRDDPIALLDDAVLTARRDQARAAIDEARANLSTRRERLRLAQQGLARLERLKGSAAFSQARFEDQRQEVAIARAEVASARAAVGRAQADFELARIEAERTEVRAPYAGVVVRRMVEAGAYVRTGDPLVRLVSDAALEVEADVPASRLAGLEPGLEVRVDLNGGPSIRAEVRAILPQENPQTRTRTVRFVPDFGPDTARLASGQSVTVRVPIGEARQVLSVHKDAVIRREGQAVIFVAQDGEAQVRAVQLGAEVGARFEVIDGVEPGALAVVRGNERLRPGDQLDIVNRRGPSGEGGSGGGGSGS